MVLIVFLLVRLCYFIWVSMYLRRKYANWGQYFYLPYWRLDRLQRKQITFISQLFEDSEYWLSLKWLWLWSSRHPISNSLKKQQVMVLNLVLSDCKFSNLISSKLSWKGCLLILLLWRFPLYVFLLLQKKNDVLTVTLFHVCLPFKV